jgi:hypothetical protein
VVVASPFLRTKKTESMTSRKVTITSLPKVRHWPRDHPPSFCPSYSCAVFHLCFTPFLHLPRPYLSDQPRRLFKLQEL